MLLCSILELKASIPHYQAWVIQPRSSPVLGDWFKQCPFDGTSFYTYMELKVMANVVQMSSSNTSVLQRGEWMALQGKTSHVPEKCKLLLSLLFIWSSRALLVMFSTGWEHFILQSNIREYLADVINVNRIHRSNREHRLYFSCSPLSELKRMVFMESKTEIRDELKPWSWTEHSESLGKLGSRGKDRGQ